MIKSISDPQHPESRDRNILYWKEQKNISYLAGKDIIENNQLFMNLK